MCGRGMVKGETSSSEEDDIEITEARGGADEGARAGERGTKVRTIQMGEFVRKWVSKRLIMASERYQEYCRGDDAVPRRRGRWRGGDRDISPAGFRGL